MIIFVFVFIVPVVFGSQNVRSQNHSVNSPANIDLLIDQSIIDEAWVNYMIKAPAAINLLGQIMVVVSVRDISLQEYSPNYIFKYIKYPKSFYSTFLQISKETDRAFHNAHTRMSKIQVHMKQILGYMKTISKITSKGSTIVVSRVLPKLLDNIERISNTCVALAHGAEDSFMSVINLLDEVIDVTKATKGGFQVVKRDDDVIELNITGAFHAAMEREEECRQRYEKSQIGSADTPKSIPTGFQALARELGRASIGFTTIQLHNLISRFSESLNSLIQILSNNENQDTKNKELRSYKIIYEAYSKMVNAIAYNNLSCKVLGLIERAIKLVDMAIKYPNASIKDELESLADDVKPFIAAEELSSTNNAPISVSLRSDSSDNELLKARIAQERLSQQEKRLDAYYTNHVAAMEQMRSLTTNLASLDLSVIRFTDILKMLEEGLKLFGDLKKNWNDLVLSFSSFSDQITTGLRLKFESFFGTIGSTLDTKVSTTDQKLFLEIIKDDSNDLYHESYVLFVLSRTYYDVSRKYLMPRLSSLSSMLSSTNNNERHLLLSKLQRDTQEVQNEIKKLIDERRKKYKKVISKKRAKINEVIDHQGADGNEMDIIKQGEKLLEIDN